MAETKTATLQVTLALVNTIFKKNGKAGPFQVPSMAALEKRENTRHVEEGATVQPFAETPLYGILKKRISRETLTLERLEVVGKALFALGITEALMIQAMPPDKLLPFINAKVEGEKNKVLLGEVLLVHMATNPKTSASYKETRLEPRTKLDEVYDNKANMENPVGVSVRVLQAIVARMWQETGVSPFELAAAIDGGRELHKTHDTLLAQLVAKNFTATAVISALQSARMTEAWTANGVDHLVEVTLFVCNYPLRAVIHHLRRAGTIETYTTKDPNVLLAQTREYDTLIEAFSPYRKYFSYFTGLEALARNNPGLRKKITDILKEAHLHSVEEIHEKVMVEYRGLDPVSTDGTDGDVFMTEKEDSMLRVDSAADATIVKPGVIRNSNLTKEEKTWRGAGRTTFKTSHSGSIQGSVDWDKREQRGEKETGSASFEVDAHVSESCKQNLLSLESMFGSPEWKYVTFQLTEDGKSYLYGQDGKRVPLQRVPGKTGWWLKVQHSDCKSLVCSQVYGLIRILGNPAKRTGPLNRRTSKVLYVVKHHSTFTLKPFSPHELSMHLLPHELDIYENLPSSCSMCTPMTILGTLQIPSQSHPDKNKSNHPETNRRVFATGMQENLTIDDVREMFADFGKIHTVRYPANVDGKQARDKAIILYRKPHEARRAHHQMKGFQMWGQPVITSLDGFTETPERGMINTISDDKIELTVTEKSMHLRLSSTYFERAKKTYEKKDKVTLTDVGEVFQLHEIYNHRSLYVLRQMFRIELPTKYTGFACDACDAGKMQRTNAHKTYSKGGSVGRDLKPGEEWHMDLMFFPEEYSYRKGRIVSTRVDGESRASDTAIIRSKVQTLSTLQVFIARSATGKPSRIRVDRGWEYLNAEFKTYCREQGIDLKPSAAYQHGQMGIAERFNRTLKEHVLSSLLARNTDMKWWPEAVHHENYVYNRVAHSGIGYSLPAEKESGKPVDTWNIKGVFGCSVKVKQNPDKKAKALEPHFRQGKFLGIAPHSSMGTYRVLMLDTNKIIYTAHVTFENLVIPRSPEPTVRTENISGWCIEGVEPKAAGTQVTITDTQPNEGSEDGVDSGSENSYVDADPDAEVDQDTNEGETRDDEPPTMLATEEKGGRSLRDRSTIARPDYFIEQATDIYSAPQLAHKPRGDVLHVSWSHPLVRNPIPPLVKRPSAPENAVVPTKSCPILIYGRNATVGQDGNVMLVESVPMDVIASEQTGRNVEESLQALSNSDDRKKRIAELRDAVKRNSAEEKKWGPPPESYKTLSEALSETNPHRDRIKAAMELEILTLYVMGTFELRPDREYSREQRQQKRIGTKWVITVKEKLFRARLVVLGYMQDKSRLYLYSPTLRRETTRQIFAKAAKTGNQLRSLDIRNAFIKEKATSEVFLLMPQYLQELLEEDLTEVRRIRLGKMLYGMADSPVVFYNGLDKHLRSHDMRRSYSDPCHFRKQDVDVGFHVDDGVYTGTDQAIRDFERHMRTYYELKDVGVCDAFTGLRAIQTGEGVYVHQIPYIRKLVKEYLQPNMEVAYSRKAATPMEEKLRLTPPAPGDETDPDAKHLPYKELRCSLMWIAYGTRLDICYAVSILGAYDHCYTRTLYKYLLRVLKYLQGTLRKCILYKAGDNAQDVESYLSKWPQWSSAPENGISADASCLTPEDKYRGRGGFIVMCNAGPIAWNAYSLKGGAKLGSYEAEFKNLSQACKDGARIQDSLVEFDLMDINQRFPVVCDNTTALQAMERPAGASKKLGHIEKHYYFVQDKIESRMKLGHVHSEYMPADILTKPLGGTKFAQLRDMVLVELPVHYKVDHEEQLTDLR